MVKIKISDILLWITLVSILLFGLYGIYILVFQREMLYKPNDGFLACIIAAAISLSVIIVCITSVMFIFTGISELAKLEFTIDINKIKQKLNNLK
tara:strand:- start:16 stop:300 length:285 start_codon:yes stop_codon:yes gene_type:complete